MNVKRKNLTLYILVLFLSVLFYIFYLYFYKHIYKTHLPNPNIIFFLSWLGIVIFIYIIISWYKISGKYFTLYTIFILFFFLFNYGQPIMWAFNIHQLNEIGNTGLYIFEKPSYKSIILTQSLTLTSIIMFHFGAIYSFKPKNKKPNYKNSEITRKAIFYTAILLAIFVLPVTFYNSIYDLLYSQKHSYHALYYDDNKTNIIFLNLIQRMFFPTLVGLLIGSKYKRNIRYFVYTVFILYLIINLLSGDRGSWIYYLIILLFMSHTFYKKINFLKISLYSVLGLSFLKLVETIVLLRRSDGINIKNFFKTFSIENSTIINIIFEVGGSMRTTLVLVEHGWDIWPYGNTYINAFIGMFTNKLFSFLGIPYENVTSWFSQGYLGISYGAGFSIVAEALLNYGPFIAPLIMIVFGMIASYLSLETNKFNLVNAPLKVFFSISSIAIFLPIVRGHFHYSLNQWTFAVLIPIILIMCMRMFLQKKVGKRENCQ